MGLKLEGSDFDKPGFFKRGEMSASLKLVGKVAWEKDRFARGEMKREKVSAHDFRREVGMNYSNTNGSCNKKSNSNSRAVEKYLY